MSVVVSYKKQFLAGFLFLIIILFTVEGVTRAYDQLSPYCGIQKIDDVYLDKDKKNKICTSFFSLVWHFDENKLYTHMPNQHLPTININSDGFRGEEISKEKLKNTYRIFALGGSTTFSIRAESDEKTWPGFLQTQFNNIKLEKKIEVINAGVILYSTTQELKLIKEKIILFEPDLIILYGGVNDLKKPIGFVPGKSALINNLSNFINLYLPFWETLPIIHHSINPIKANYEKIFFDDEEIKNKVSTWKKNLIEICEYGKKENFKTVVILQPILGTGNKPMSDFEKDVFVQYEDSEIKKYYQRFADELPEIEKYCSITGDFRGIFDNTEEQIFFDNDHVNYLGNSMVSEKMIQTIIKEIKD